MGNRASSYLDDGNALFAPAAKSATTWGTGVDISDYDGFAHVVLANAAVTHDGTLTIKMQDSGDNSTFADVTGDTFVATGTAAAVQVIRIDTRDYDQYARIHITASTTAAITASVALVGRKKYTD